MINKNEKILLESYGLFRMVLGIAQLVGLCFSYFLLEFVIKYPSSQLLQIFDEDVIALIVLAVIIRGLFHLIVGIGIVRLREWSKIWICWGWPLILIINVGVFYVHYHDFNVSGQVSHIFEMVSFGKIFAYSLLIVLDYVLISSQISLFDSDSVLEEIGGRLQANKVFAIFVIVFIFFCAIMFLSHPIKKGFHRGFYKSSGKMSKGATKKRVLVSTPQKDVIKKQVEANDKIVLIEAKTKILKIDEKNTQGKIRLVEGKKKKKIRKGLPYRGMMAVVSSLCLIVGFLMQLFSISELSKQNDSLLFSYSRFSFGCNFFCIFTVNPFACCKFNLFFSLC